MFRLVRATPLAIYVASLIVRHKQKTLILLITDEMKPVGTTWLAIRPFKHGRHRLTLIPPQSPAIKVIGNMMPGKTNIILTLRPCNSYEFPRLGMRSSGNNDVRNPQFNRIWFENGHDNALIYVENVDLTAKFRASTIRVYGHNRVSRPVGNKCIGHKGTWLRGQRIRPS